MTTTPNKKNENKNGETVEMDVDNGEDEDGNADQYVEQNVEAYADQYEQKDDISYDDDSESMEEKSDEENDGKGGIKTIAGNTGLMNKYRSRRLNNLSPTHVPNIPNNLKDHNTVANKDNQKNDQKIYEVIELSLAMSREEFEKTRHANVFIRIKFTDETYIGKMKVEGHSCNPTLPPANKKKRKQSPKNSFHDSS